MSDKIWQIMQSNNTRSENLDKDFEEMLERSHRIG